MIVQQERDPVADVKPSEPRFKRLSVDDRAAELIQAGLAVLAAGGITAFTIDNITRRAAASRGLISHHFGGKNGLLAACYAAAYAPLLQLLQSGAAPPALPDLIEELFSDRQFRREGLNIWLALWGEIAVNPLLMAEHLKHYRTYHSLLATSIARHVGRGRPKAADTALATALIALLDGIWVEFCFAPQEMSRTRARAAVATLLSSHLGPLQGRRHSQPDLPPPELSV